MHQKRVDSSYILVANICTVDIGMVAIQEILNNLVNHYTTKERNVMFVHYNNIIMILIIIIALITL